MLRYFIIFMLFFNIAIAAEIQIPKLDMFNTLKRMASEDGKYSNFLLGVVYMNGDKKTKRDIPKAIEYLKKDSENLAYANYLLGVIFANYPSEKPRFNKSIEYFKRAATIKSVDSKEVNPVAYAAMGNVYLNYIGDKKAALRSLLKASSLKVMPNVDFTIALIYYTSKPPIRNEKLAEIYLNRAYKNADATLRTRIDRYIIKPSSEKPNCINAGGKLCQDLL